MMDYTAARAALAEALLRDAAAHEASKDDEIGRRFDSLEHVFPRGTNAELAKLRIALTFWDGWIDARNHGWQPSSGIQRHEWPNLARDIAADLAADRDILNPSVRARFDAETHASLGERVQILAARLRDAGVSR
jgi:hypothetical protein